jgi:hypothetical protein
MVSEGHSVASERTRLNVVQKMKGLGCKKTDDAAMKAL